MKTDAKVFPLPSKKEKGSHLSALPVRNWPLDLNANTLSLDEAFGRYLAGKLSSDELAGALTGIGEVLQKRAERAALRSPQYRTVCNGWSNANIYLNLAAVYILKAQEEMEKVQNKEE